MPEFRVFTQSGARTSEKGKQHAGASVVLPSHPSQDTLATVELGGVMSTQPTRTQAPCPQITPVDGTKLLHAGLNLLASQDGQLCYVYVSRTALTSPAQAR